MFLSLMGRSPGRSLAENVGGLRYKGTKRPLSVSFIYLVWPPCLIIADGVSPKPNVGDSQNNPL